MSAPLVDPAVLDKVRGWREYVEAKLGFRNHWYPVVFITEVREGEPGIKTALVQMTNFPVRFLARFHLP